MMAARFSEVAHTMINKKQSLTLLSAIALSVSLSACSVFDWLIYKPDIPQGNYMEPQQVEKLRIDMTKEQELILHFTGNKLSLVKGDYELSPEFNTPLEQSKLPMVNTAESAPQVPAQRPDEKPLVKENQTEAQVQKPIK